MRIRKLFAVLMAVIMLATAAGCGKKEEAEEEKKSVKVIDINLTDENYAFGVDKDKPELLSKVNDFIAKIQDDGTFDEICNHYFGDGTPVAVNAASLDTSKEQLVIATNAAFEPFEYTKGDSYYGIDMEIAALLANELGMELVIQNMDFNNVCESVGNHESDIVMAALTVREDREAFVDFSVPYYSASQKLIVMSDNTEFDNCQDAEDVMEILRSKDEKTNVGVQTETTGQYFCEGDKEAGFDGFSMTITGYKNGYLAVQELINKNIDLVIIDSAPAVSIAEAINLIQ